MTTIKEKAYAKINLYLDVVGLRDDGFHDIKTVMHSVSLYDEITLSVTPSKELSIKMHIEGNHFLPCDSKNLAYRAAFMFCERLGIKANVFINLKKNIPLAAGLAGGSSDAAAVLRALNKIYKKPMTSSALSSLGAEIGSDVPYCIFGKTALCLGRGEKIIRIKTSAIINAVIANSGEHVSTPDAYRALDAAYSNFDGSVWNSESEKCDTLISDLNKGYVSLDNLFNIFEGVILPTCDKTNEIKEKMLSFGADRVMMSGSGPSLVGFFKSSDDAKDAAQKLSAEGISAYYVKTV